MKLAGYRLVAELSNGEHTTVYRAVREHDGLPVVLKTLSHDYPSPSEVRRLEFEHRILDKLRGPGVIALLGLARSGGQLALILEDFGGADLARRMLPLPLSEFFRVARQAAAALGHVHGLGVIHKNVKPQNLLVNADLSRLALIDFQLASEISRERRDLDAAHQLEGSLPYMSPEQTGRMNRALDYRSDYYSLGVTFFELLTGRLPFLASDGMGWVHCHISKAAPDARSVAPDLPVMLARLVAKLLAKEPRERYQSSRGLMADLTRCEALWREGRPGEELPLGAEDVSERFALSQRLVGRASEVHTLTRVLDEACAGPAKLLVISGYSGVGKSSLIREVYAPLATRRGYFGAGKFDQLERSVPYAALVEALRQRVRQMLAETDPQIQYWRERISIELGSGCSVMAELIPELARVIGPQPAPPPLEPAAAQNRFKFVFARFIKALASADHPLVLFLDDLQWADASTPDLIGDLFIADDARHLLVIVAYRDNEVSAAHLLALTLQKLRAAVPRSVVELTLAPLDADAVCQIVAGALRCAPAECRELARQIHDRTAGNPFFTSELLWTLYGEGAITFSASDGRFRCDLSAARELAAADSVVELLLRRLERLPPDVLHAVRLAACIGNVFALSTLASLLERSPDATAALLRQPIAEGLLIPLDDNYKLMQFEAADTALHAPLEVRYRFQHDRVQQAAYSLIADGDKAITHLCIGRRLLAAERDAEHPEDVFAPTNHLNLGRAAMTHVSEREALAKLNRKAGARALAATAFALAARYHEAGVDALTPEEWAERAELRFALFSERVGSLLMAGERERAASLCEDLFALAPSTAARGAVYLIKTQIMMHQGRMLEAIGAVRQGLALLGIDYPEDPAAIERDIGAGIGKMQAHLARVPIEQLVQLPELADAEKIVALQLLFNAVAPAIMVYPPLFILAELIMFDLALSHGTTAVCAKNFVDCGLIQGAALGDYASAYRLGKVAFKVVERYDARALSGQVHFVFAAYVSPWGAPYAEALRSFEESRRLNIEAGDHQHLAFNETLYLRMLLALGRHLDECDAVATGAAALLDRIRAEVQGNGIRLSQLAIEQLRGLLDARELERRAARLRDEIVASGNAQYAFQHGQVQMLVHALFGAWDGALGWWEFARARQVAASTLLVVPEYHLLEVLITTQLRWARASAAERPALLGEIDRNVARLEGWTRGCAENFAHKYHLAAAERARVNGEPADAVAAWFERAIEATAGQFLHLSALAHELFAEYWLELGQPRSAEPLFQKALELYARWGAAAKVRQLKQRLDASLPRQETPAPAASLRPAYEHTTLVERALGQDALDLSSVLKVSRAISGEVRSERLFAALMHAILENAAAQHGCLVMCEEPADELWVRARADQRSSERGVSARHPLEQEPRVCRQIVRYVARSHEALVVDDATRDPSFGSDPYVLEHGTKSVLCMPVVNQGRLVAILYMENNATTNAFTAARVETLRLIAGQAAIAITNASLYESLERKVEDRTRELAAKTRKMAAMLDGIEQGIFTLDEELRVQPEYSRHLERLAGRQDLVGRSVSELLFEGSELDPARIAAHESALRFSFGASLAIAALNAEHLIKEYTRRGADGSQRHYEVDWSWITGEDGTVERVLVAARDVTVLRGLKQAAAEAEREKEILGQIFDAGLEDFKSFCETSLHLLEQHQAQRLAADRARSPERRRALFRDVHTIKGHARTLGLGPIVAAAHAAEQALVSSAEPQLGGGGPAPRHAEAADGSAGSRLEGALAGSEGETLGVLAALIREYEQTGARKLGRLWAGADARFKQALGAIESALAQTPGRPSYPARALSQAREIVQRLNAIPLEQVLRETSRVFPALARELGKSVPEIEWHDDGVVLDAEWGRVMKDALMHTFRNSLDHGIETSEERQALGKAPRGKIALRAERDAQGVRIHLSDDGRGLPLAALRTKTGRLDSPDRDVAEAIFDYGISTAPEVSQVSGRGIGMDAVRGFLRERGGDVEIAFTGDGHAGYRPFELVFKLPESAMIRP